MIELTVLNDSVVDLNTVDDGLVDLDVVMATGGGSAPTLQTKSVTYTPTESEQTDSVTPDVGYDGLSEVDVTVGAIDPEYVGSDVPRKSSSDLTASGATVTVPSGYYSASASKSGASGTEGTPTATKGAVSNHAVSVTPSVTNSAGYISGGTKTGSAVSVSASELVSGTKSISANGTEDVTNYASVSVSVPNSYSASDEGKVVDNGALVSQTSDTVTANDTYDTTLINSLTVNVSGGGNIGGLANMVDVTNTEYAVAYMLSQMKNGNTAGGKVTYASAFANTEQLILSTGLTTIHGFMFVCPTYDMLTNIGTGQSNKFYFFFRHSYESNPNHYCNFGQPQQPTSNSTLSSSTNRVLGTKYESAPDNGAIRIDGGNIYYSARYNKNANYQIVRPNIEYEWLAW